MAGKRKRKRSGTGAEGGQKRQKIALEREESNPIIKSALLVQFYPQVLTLRQYLLSKLPANSKVRTKKIRNMGKRSSLDREVEDGKFSDFLDQTLVGVSKGTDSERWKQWNTFSQRGEESASTLANLSGMGRFCQSEVCTFQFNR